MSALHPIWVDIAEPLVLVAVGIAGFLTGRRLHVCTRSVRGGVIGFIMCLIVFAAASHYYPLKDYTGPFTHWFGSEGVLACWGALLLVGVAWSSPNRSMSNDFLGFLILLACFFLFASGSAHLLWRCWARDMWARHADASGNLAQSSGMTCSPTAAVMLLHHYGITASEGEMAYLARTSVFGTDPHAMAHALTLKVRSLGWRVKVDKSNYEECVREGLPFIAHTHIPGIGAHALYVRLTLPDRVSFSDPRNGGNFVVPREKFLSWWDGRRIVIFPIPAKHP